MNAIRVEKTVEADGELHLTALPLRQGDRVEAIVLVLEQSSGPAPDAEREYQTFLRLLPELLATHQGKYVAIHCGQVVDSDTDEVALILRVQAKVGYVPIHVGRVTAAQPVVRIPHYHEVRPRRNP